MQPSKGFLIWLAGLSILGFLATDMYLPAFTAIEQDLKTSASAVSASLSLYLAGFALAQLLWGPLSDNFGRKPILLTGLTLFSCGCLGMMWAENATLLLILRFIQAIGVCSATVSWQALVTDYYPAHRVSRIFATIMPLVALSPALAPLAGSWILSHYGWKSIFFILFIITLLLMLPIPGLTPPHNKKSSTSKISASYLTMLRSRVYCGNVLIYAACTASFFAWLSGSPFMLNALGYGPATIGLSYLPQTIAFLIGGYGCRSALQKWQGEQLLPWLLVLYSFSVLATWLVAMRADVNLTQLLVPFCMMAIANGAIYPIVVAAALRIFPQASGKAAALQNALQLGLCFLASLTVSYLISRPLSATTGVMMGTTLLSITGFFIQRSQTLSQPENSKKSG